MRYTKQALKKLLEENKINKTSDNITTLMMIALDHGLINRELYMSEVKEVVAKNPVGRPRKYPKNTTTEVPIRDPKYDRLIRIRNNPVSVRLTNVETGEIKIYTSLYKAMNETRHSWRYLKARNGKVDEGFKIEIP